MNRVGGRKFVVVLLALLLGFILSLAGKMTGEFATIVSISVGAYMAAHGAQEWKQNSAKASAP